MSVAAREQQPFWHGMVAGGSSGVISRLFTCAPFAREHQHSAASLSQCARASAPQIERLCVCIFNALWFDPPHPLLLVADPPDTVKSRLQVQGASGSAVQYAGTLDAFTKVTRDPDRVTAGDRRALDLPHQPPRQPTLVQIFRREGVPGFYRGFGAILLTVVPANMCYFS